MQREVFEPLAPGEESMRIQIEISQWVPTHTEAQIRALVLKEFYRYAGVAEYEVLRGPEISVYQLPRNPGDPAIAIALGVGRPAMR